MEDHYLGNGEPIQTTPNPSSAEIDALLDELRTLTNTEDLTSEQLLRLAALTELVPRKLRELDDSLCKGRNTR